MYTQPAIENPLGSASIRQEQFRKVSQQERNKHELQVYNNLDPETVKNWLRKKLGDLTQSVDIKPFENGQAYGLDPKRTLRFLPLEERTVKVIISGSDEDAETVPTQDSNKIKVIKYAPELPESLLLKHTDGSTTIICHKQETNSVVGIQVLVKQLDVKGREIENKIYKIQFSSDAEDFSEALKKLALEIQARVNLPSVNPPR
jgi:hypothetical protein